MAIPGGCIPGLLLTSLQNLGNFIMSESLSPSASIVAAANNVSEIRDVRGRVIKWRYPGVIDQARILRAIGPDNAENKPYLAIVLVACSVVSIDGIARPMPTNERQIDASIMALSDDGFSAISVMMDREKAKSRAEAEEANHDEG
jgi:hypothetical protein